MSLFSVLKHNSRLALRGSWGKAILILLVTFGVSLVMQVLQEIAVELFVPPVEIDSGYLQYGVNEYIFQYIVQANPLEYVILGISVLLTVLLASPISLGTAHWHYRLVLGRPAPVPEVFRYFESGAAYRRAVWYEINLSARCLLWAIPFFVVPGGIYGASMYTLLRAGEHAQRTQVAMASVGLLLAVVLFLLAAVFYSAAINRYVLTAYLLAEDDTRTVNEAIRLSVEYSKGYRFSFLWYQLTFTGWFLLCLFLLPALYVMPYYNTACAMYARYIIEKSRFAPPQQTREFVLENHTPPAREPEPSAEHPPETPAEPSDPYGEFRSPAPGEPEKPSGGSGDSPLE